MSSAAVSSVVWMIVGLVLQLMAADTLRAQDSDADDLGAIVPGDDADTVATAREHFKRGTEYYGEGDYRSALIEFERAHALRHSFRLLYNLGQVSYELRDYAAAERYFRAYLVEGEDEITAERRDEVKAELGRLRERVASLDLQTTPSGAVIQVDDHAVGTTPFTGPLRVSAGRRRVTAELAGRASIRRTIDLVGGESRVLKLRFGPPLVGTEAAIAGNGSSSMAPWVTGIMSGAFAVGSGALAYAAWRDTVSYEDQLSSYTTRDRLEVISSNAHTKAVVADVLLGAAVVSAVITTVLLLTDEPRDIAAKSRKRAEEVLARSRPNRPL